MKKIYYLYLVILFIVTVSVLVFINYKRNLNDDSSTSEDPIKYNFNTGSKTDFDYKIIHEVNKNFKSNYMISPLSIAYALSILRDGSSDNTKTELDKVLNDYKLLNIVNVKNRISLANALFIKEEHKKSVKQTYIDKIKNDYGAEIIFDKFKNPDRLNNWVKDKTFNMIEKTVDDIDPNFLLGIVNTIAIDVEWKDSFECNSTKKDKFNLKDGTKMDTAYMNSSSGVSYFETKDAKGIIKDYKKYNYLTGESTYEESDNNIELEYIAILPNNLDDYMKSFNNDKLKDIYKNIKTGDKIHLSLPKYTYDFDYETFKGDLQLLGIKDAFDEINANFKNITDDSIYVDKAIHKSHIELTESGTKAAAVTAIMLNFKSAIYEGKTINIVFDRPFIYLIKEKNSDNIWFFGAVYEPIKWEEHKCETKENN